ncbi:M67 family metallopeptidase [Cohnella sp. REN36]|uniref:M67 family metallopeptidase n=1 Tax=Cohnella sp. REN36 TaxID=2887347 RepID=UPI001D13E2DD|nr:M67 family metallopeptidase [Cohnella sp. REN36]
MTTIRSISVQPELLGDLVETCRIRLPSEACGVIVGKRAGDEVLAQRFILLRNVAADPLRSFRFAPEEWVRIYSETQKNQREIVGFFHVHPRGEPYPSAADLAGWDGSGTYWIVGSSGDAPAVRAYALRPDGKLRDLALPSLSRPGRQNSV